MSKTIEIFGKTFRIEKNPKDDGTPATVGYFLYGVRGAIYGMLRPNGYPNVYYVVNSRRCTMQWPGEWFTVDADMNVERY